MPQYCTNPTNSRPCRKCEGCAKWKIYTWKKRIARELSISPKTWFVTLTFSSTPSLAYLKTTLSKYLKRVRKKTDFRYFAVVEKGTKHSRLHYHVLIHCYPTKPIPYRLLKNSYNSGFFHAKIVNSLDASSYISKYITKQPIARIRCSKHYGYLPLGNLNLPPLDRDWETRVVGVL